MTKNYKVIILVICIVISKMVFAIDNVDSLLKLLPTVNSDSIKVEILNDLSDYYRNNDADAALLYNKEAINIGEEIAYLKELIVSYNIHSFLLGRTGNYVESIEFQLKSLDIAKQLNDTVQMANILDLIGSRNSELGEYEKAAQFFNESLELFITINDTLGIATTYLHIGNNLYRSPKGVSDEIIGNLEKSIELFGKINNEAHLSAALMNLATVKKDLGYNLNEVLNDYYLAANSFEKFKDFYGYSVALANIGEVLLIQNKKEEGENKINEALKIAKQIKFTDFIIHCHSLLHDHYKKIHAYEKALFHFERMTTIKDSIFNETKSKQIADIETKYQTKENEQKIALLNEKNKVQQLKLDGRNRWLWVISIFTVLVFVIIILIVGFQRSKISKNAAEFSKTQSELKQQALRTQMNPHFLFNSLNSIQRIYVEGNMTLANDYMADFSTLLRGILNNSDKEKITLEEDIQMLELYLSMEKMRTNGLICYEIILDAKINSLDINIPPMIVQPFVENAIWHGILPTKKQGNLKISFDKVTSSTIKCIVEDDGIGIKKSKEGKNNNHISKGMELTRNRLGNTNAVLEEELVEGGTRITINIPIS